MGEVSEREEEVRRHRQYLQAVTRFPALSEEEEVRLTRRWLEHQDRAARDKLIESHLRLVPNIARCTADKYGFKPPSQAPREAWDGYDNVCRELLAAGNEGLLVAARRFDPRRGPRFSECAPVNKKGVLGGSEISKEPGQVSEA
jgi:RNA polymerase sigma-32 factor